MRNNTEEILDLKYKKSKLESNYKTLVEFLECAQSDSAVPGIFYKTSNQGLFVEKFFIDGLGEEAEDLWNNFHDKLFDAVRDYKMCLEQEINDIENLIIDLNK